jgi:magnesium chelatase subunit D
MTGAETNQRSGRRRWEVACDALRILAVDPIEVGGAVLRCAAGPVRDEWLQALQSALPSNTPWRRMPAAITDERLLGGLDLAATLRAGSPMVQAGLLRESDGGIVLLAMAERIEAGTAARLAAVLDHGGFRLERDGFAAQVQARIACVALDESFGDDEQLPNALLQRLPLLLDLSNIGLEDFEVPALDEHRITTARHMLGSVQSPPEIIEALCAAAMALGIDSLRAPLMALRVARICAALAGRDYVTSEDASLAAGLVLAPRATRMPAPAEPEAAQQEPPQPQTPPPDTPPPPQTESEQPQQDPEVQTQSVEPLQEQILAAAQAAIPADLLLHLLARNAAAMRQRSQGRSGALQQSRRRGRPAGVRQGTPRVGQRLSVVDTLRSAAPWQSLRRNALPAESSARQRVQVRSEDFHVRRYKQRSETATVFVIDASGSAALHRLAEAKGAIELLLAQCYIRRDQVAVIAFRGRAAEVLLPPTRSLVRARRSLAGLPGGGGTPLAAGIDAGAAMAASLVRAGLTPTVVLLTDGRGNVTREGVGNREQATQEALSAAKALRSGGHRVLVIDTGPRPQPQAAQLSTALGGLYLPLPHADASVLASAVQRSRQPADKWTVAR